MLIRARGRRAGERGEAALLAASSVADPDEAVEFGLGAGGGRGCAEGGEGGAEGEGGGGDGLVVAELDVVLAVCFEMLRLPIVLGYRLIERGEEVRGVIHAGSVPLPIKPVLFSKKYVRA